MKDLIKKVLTNKTTRNPSMLTKLAIVNANSEMIPWNQ